MNTLKKRDIMESVVNIRMGIRRIQGIGEEHIEGCDPLLQKIKIIKKEKVMIKKKLMKHLFFVK